MRGRPVWAVTAEQGKEAVAEINLDKNVRFKQEKLKKGVSWKADRNTGIPKKRTWWKTERGNVLFHKISRGAVGQCFQFTSALEEVGGARPWVQEFPGLEREFKFRMNCVDRGTSTKQQKTNYKGNHVRLNLELWQTEAHHSLNSYRSRSQQTRQWEILS